MYKLRARWNLFWRVKDLDSSPCEVLMKVNCGRSLMVRRTMSMSASPIVSHCFTINFLKFLMVIPRVSFLSSWMSSDRWLKIWLILSTYCSASYGFCAPASGHSSSSSSSSRSITGGTSLKPFLTDVLDTDLRRGATELAPPKQGSEWWFWQEQQLI